MHLNAQLEMLMSEQSRSHCFTSCSYDMPNLLWCVFTLEVTMDCAISLQIFLSVSFNILLGLQIEC